MFNAQEEKDNFIRENFINFRPFALSALAMATGATFCYAALFHGVNLSFSLLCLLPCAIRLIFSPEKRRAVVCLFLFLAFLGVGMGGFALRMENYGNQNLSEGTYVLTGEIAGIAGNESAVRILLKNVKADGEETDGNVTLYLYGVSAQGEEGMKIRLSAFVQPLGSAYRYGTFRADMALQNIKYTATASSVPVVAGDSSDWFVSVRAKIRKTLYENLPEEEASLAYALTTGNTEGVEEELISSVRYGGIAHLFAVSGLHIGIVYAALTFLSGKCKLPKSVGSLLALFASFLFCGVCGFSPSSLRAFLVCVAHAAVFFFGIRADGVEGAGFACGIILLVNPVYLFSVGFQLSAVAYIAIVLLSPGIRKLFSPICGRFPRLESSLGTVSVMLSVQIALFPVMLNAFGYASVWGLLLNPLILPLFSLYFPVLLASVLLSCAFPAAASVILFLPGAVLSLFALFFHTLDFSAPVVRGFSFGTAAIAAFYALLFLCGARVNVSKRRLAPVACFLVAVTVFDVFAGGFALDDCRVTQFCYYNGFCCALVRTKEADILLVNGRITVSRMQTFLSRRNARPDAVVVAAEDVNDCVNGLIALSVPRIYVRAGEDVSLRTREVVSSDRFSFGGADFEFRTDEALLFTYDGVTGVFNGTGYDADFSVFFAEERDGLIFKINRGILSVG